MLKNERMDEILDILRTKQHTTVEYLSKHIYVSSVTIRRDLRKMEELGLVQRSYGGVSLVQHVNKVEPLYMRNQNFVAEKMLIAKRAVALIQEGDTLFMDASSTILHMANFLDSNMNVTVFTNSIRLAAMLCDKHVTVYCTGGLLLNQSFACIGSYADNTIGSINVDRMFFSAQGYSQDGTISDFSEAESNLRRLALKHAKRRYFLCDSSKLGKKYLFTICQKDDIDEILCDKDPDEVFGNG